MDRKPLGKRLRFSIFHRDGFTCQYCGRTPEQDEVILHVDHIISVKDGGTDDKQNLITSCRDCNLGKSAKSILKRNKSEQDIAQELEQTKERLEQLKQLTISRKKIQKVRQEISSLDKQEIIENCQLDFDEKMIELLAKAKTEIKNDDCFFKALEITENKFSSHESYTRQLFINYLRGVARNLNLPSEHSEILREYNNEIFRNDRMDKKTRTFILENADLGIEHHQEVIRRIQKFWSKNHGECYKLRDEVKEVFNYNQYTVFKSGINLQLMVCDTIVMVIEDSL
jgi:hypothetical protein